MTVAGGRSWPSRHPGSAARARAGCPPPIAHRSRRLPPLVQLIDACLLSLLFVAPLLMGGRHPVGHFAWMAIAAVLGFATLLHYRPVKPSAGDFVWLAACVLVVAQLMPLPASLLTSFNPGLDRLLPGITEPNRLPFSEAIYSSPTISVNPYRTRLALGMLLAYGIIFHSLTRRVQTVADVRRLLAWIAAATVAMAILALAQRFAGNGKFLWIYQHVSRDASDVVKGTFQNQNHFAQLMALGLGPLLYFATSRRGPWRTALATSGATICLLAALLTFSRGGAIAIATAAATAIGGLLCAGHLNRKGSLRLVLPALITVALLGIWGGERLLASVQTLAQGSELATVAPGRLELWQSHLKAIAASPWVGFGAASHEDVYPAFIETDFGANFTHGESGYLPIQLENGLPGTALLVCALLLTLRWSAQCLRVSPEAHGRNQVEAERHGDFRAMAVACIGGLSASAVQSVADFVWYIPACLTVTLMLLACLYRLASIFTASRAAHKRSVSPNVPWLAVPVATLAVATSWSVGPARASHLWDQYRALTKSYEAADANASTTTSTTEVISLLEKAVALDRLNPVPRLRLAAVLLSTCDKPDRQSPVTDKALRTAARHHAIAALRLAPLRGEGYVVLADALRRTHGDRTLQLRLLQQAVHVRQHDTDVRFQAGLAGFRGGHVSWGFDTWKPVMEVPTAKRDQILGTLAGLLPPDLLLQSFSLDSTALATIYKHHKASDAFGPELRTRIGRQLVDALVQEAGETDADQAAALLYEASRVTQETGGSLDQVTALASQAVAASPSEYRYRTRLTDLLIRDQRWEDARTHLQWCQARRPRDPKIGRQQEQIEAGARRL